MANKKKTNKKKKAAAHKNKNGGGNNPIPVTILSGFLGSGKTTLLKHILESSGHKLKVAVIVNDMAELNIDAAVIQQQSMVVQTEREVVSLQNGCICCTLRGDLIREIARIRQSNDFDYVLIESTGIAEPQQVAQAFLYDPDTAELATRQEQMLWTQARLDTCVTVVDAHSFHGQMASLQQFSEQFDDGLTMTEEGVKEGERPISDLLMEQTEFANTILLNKTDLVSEEEQAQIVKLIRTLNPTAKIVPTQYSKVDLKEILNTSLFDMQKASQSPGWLQPIRQTAGAAESHHSEADEYGVVSFVYRARRPFHPNRIGGWVASILHDPTEWKRLSPEQRQASSADPKSQLMLAHYGCIYRAKGFAWLAYHDSFMMGLTAAGRIGNLHPVMPWYAVMGQDGWGVPRNSQDYKIIQSKFQAPHGDRRQEIVFIGTHLKTETIQFQLDSCLLTDEELKEYKFYNDTRALG